MIDFKAVISKLKSLGLKYDAYIVFIVLAVFMGISSMNLRYFIVGVLAAYSYAICYDLIKKLIVGKPVSIKCFLALFLVGWSLLAAIIFCIIRFAF